MDEEKFYYPILQSLDTEQAIFRSADITVVMNRTEWEASGRQVQLDVGIKPYSEVTEEVIDGPTENP